MDWSNEPYVKVYTRETDDDLALTWEAVALWNQLMKRFDRSGFLETRRGARGLAAITRVPLQVVTRVLPELIEDGRLVEVDGGFLAPNYIAAQEASKSDKLRQKDSRDRRRARALDHGVANRDGAVTERDEVDTERDIGVTTGHAQSRRVTLCSADPDPSADPLPAIASARAIHPTVYDLAKLTWQALSEARLMIAAELGLTNVIGFPDRFGMPSEPRACHDLRDRVREEGDGAEAACRRVVENLIAQARDERSIEWLAEKAFTAGGWQHARSWVPRQHRPQKREARAGAIGASTPHKNFGEESKAAKEVM